MYTAEEFDKAKTRVFKYVLYQRRTEQEVRTKFITTMDKNMLEDIIDYLKETTYIDDKEYIKRKVGHFIKMKDLSIIEIEYKLLAKGLYKKDIEQYMEENEELLNRYEQHSISNIIEKKSKTSDIDAIKRYLQAKGYRMEYIKKAIEQIEPKDEEE